MATQPKPHPKPYPDPDPPPPKASTSSAVAHEADKPVQREVTRTVADEQRERSDDIARKGVEQWKAEHDSRTDEEKKPHQIPGVGPTTVQDGKSTPEARKYQNPAASK
jgi:hypothetical protein